MEGGTRLARSLEEVGQLFGISKDTLRRAAARGELRVIRISKRLLVPEEEVKRLSQEGLGRHLAKPMRTGKLRKQEESATPRVAETVPARG